MSSPPMKAALWRMWDSRGSLAHHRPYRGTSHSKLLKKYFFINIL
jgi:hypothetical protein